MSNALSAAEQALLSGEEDKLYEALKAVGTQNLQGQNKGWYLKQLQADRETKEQVGISVRTELYFHSMSVLQRLLLCLIGIISLYLLIYFIIRSLRAKLW